MVYVVYAVAALLLASLVLFIKVVFFDKRPQKIGLIFMLIAVPSYLVYYNDRWPTVWGELRMRELAAPLQNYTPQADVHFVSDVAPALIVGGILLIHLVVFQRVNIRRRLARISDPIATFFAGSVAATLFGGILVSTFHWGWQGAVLIALGFALIYLGALALVAAIVELMAALARLFGVYLKRKVFWVATMITRAASWISSLGGRLVSRALLEKIREDTARQEAIFSDEQETQDRSLEDAYVRDRNRRRLARERGRLRERKGAVDPLNRPPASVPVPAPVADPPAAVPTAAASPTAAVPTPEVNGALVAEPTQS